MWIVPESVGNVVAGPRFAQIVNKLEQELQTGQLEGLGAQREESYFTRMAREEQGLIFHFFFWEPVQAQELIHLMVEDVPPERLARLEKNWASINKSHFGKSKDDLRFTDIISSLYKTMIVFGGKSANDIITIRKMVLDLIGRMLEGRHLPVETIKQALVVRIPGLIHGDQSWDAVRKNLRYAQLWIDYMCLLNEEGWQ